mmetsp:Transcript_2107/g.5842  ORF Transcript_2107/g.5842 Transcript_2107/m.5842 type:complete len:192 (-) Transcript_2107:65-640(-)
MIRQCAMAREQYVDQEGTERHASVDRGCGRFVLLLAFGVALQPISSHFHWAHPVQCDFLQFLGAVFLVLGGWAWVAVHCNMGLSWSPQPTMLRDHQLVTTGMFRVARHPMYAIFVWVLPAVALGTLDWVRTLGWLCWVLFILRRIPEEEGMMIELFGDEYLEYQQRVGPLGPKWCCSCLGGAPPKNDSAKV